jgi:hypothetical protein
MSKCLLLNVEEIRSDLKYGGWVMGPFHPAADIRRTTAFEIKEWSRAGIQPEWKEHRESGSEYIAVLSGVLTVYIGRSSHNNISPEIVDIIELGAHQRLVLAAGVWRRFEGSGDVTGVTVRETIAR